MYCQGWENVGYEKMEATCFNSRIWWSRREMKFHGYSSCRMQGDVLRSVGCNFSRLVRPRSRWRTTTTIPPLIQPRSGRKKGRSLWPGAEESAARRGNRGRPSKHLGSVRRRSWTCLPWLCRAWALTITIECSRACMPREIRICYVYVYITYI